MIFFKRESNILSFIGLLGVTINRMIWLILSIRFSYVREHMIKKHLKTQKRKLALKDIVISLSLP